MWFVLKCTYIQDAALERRFQPVMIHEPSLDDTVAILKGVASKYEEFHGLKYTDEAILAAGIVCIALYFNVKSKKT